MSLKLEITELTGNKPSDSYEFVGSYELAIILNPQPHSQHAIQRSEAATWVERIRQRLGNAMQPDQTDDAL